MFLFKVEDTFMLSGLGLVLIPAIGGQISGTGTKIKLIRLDGSELITKISGLSFNAPNHILVDSDLKKEDVPLGTEVWTVE